MVVSRRGMKLARGLGWVSRAGVAASAERDERAEGRAGERERERERAREERGAERSNAERGSERCPKGRTGKRQRGCSEKGRERERQKGWGIEREKRKA